MERKSIDAKRVKFVEECKLLEELLSERLEKLAKFSFGKLVKRFSRGDRKVKQGSSTRKQN